MRYFLCIAALFTSVSGFAEEGMWTYDNFPTSKVAQRYGFQMTKEWLDEARQSSVRLAQGCSASFVSPNGLIMTNHHCVASCVAELSTKEKDLHKDGYYAAKPEQELKCPNFEANTLVEIIDVTPKVMAALKGLDQKAANDARRAEFAKLEKACSTAEDIRCDVVTLYAGGQYHLYKYKRYQDVRLVFAPEFGIAFFGGDPDNFMFPRYDLDVSFIRAYEQGKPVASKHYFRWSAAGAKENELTFVSGHPGTTERLLPIAFLELNRDFTIPYRLLFLSEIRGMLEQFGTRGKEQRRISLDDLFSVENSLKAFKGEREALVDKAFFAQKIKAEQDLRNRINADPKLKAQFGSLWSDVEKVVPKWRAQYAQNRLIEMSRGFQSALYGHAKLLVRLADETAKPNEKRLKEFAEARIPEVREEILSAAPIYKELELEKLTWSLTRIREDLGADHPFVRKFFGKRSPREIATEAITNSKLDSLEERKKLLDGGKAAIDASTDPMILLAKQVDPDARAIRKQFEDEVESVVSQTGERLGQARFAVYGSSMYPDATFSLRLSYGGVKGYMENGKEVRPFTIMGGAFERHTGRDPFALPQSWLDAKDKLNLQTRMNFVTTNDIIGGNSGSPVFNQKREIVGLVFDGNIQSLGGAFGFDESVNRTVAVHSAALTEALTKIYGAKRVVEELMAK